MKLNYQQLLKPDIIKSISGLALIAKVIVDGYMSGLNHSRRVGPGMEFSQFRSYEPGDDLRLLDWKMLARSGRYYIKQSEIETNIAVKFILDASNSMMHEEQRLSKMDYVRVLVASLSYLCQNQGDAIGLFALNDEILYSLYPKIQKKHFNRFLSELINIENKGSWPIKTSVSRKLHDRTHKELIFFITDMYENEGELTTFVKRLKTLRNEVVVLHIMGKNEQEFNYKGVMTFEDLESGTKIKVDTKEAKMKYIKSLERMMKKNKDMLLANDISYHLMSINDNIGETIELFLKKRNKLV